MKIKTEVKIGFIVLLTILLVIWGINYLKGKNILNRTDVYYAVYNTAKGLEFAAPVYINGYKVGLINRFDFEEDNLNRIVVALIVDKQYSIPEGSVARIISTDIMSPKAIEIVLSDSDQFHVYGDTIKSSTEPDLMYQLQANITPLLTNVEKSFIQLDSLLTSLNKVFNEEGISSLQSSLLNLKHISGKINAQFSSGGSIQKSLSNIENFSSAIIESRENVQGLISNMASISDTLMYSGLGNSLEKLGNVTEDLHILLENIKSGEGTLGALAVDDSLYNKMVDVSVNLDLLLQDLRERPKRYVHFSIFGKKDKN